MVNKFYDDPEAASQNCLPSDSQRLPNYGQTLCLECGVRFVEAYVSDDLLKEEGVTSICELSIQRVAELADEAHREDNGRAEIQHTCEVCGSNA